MFNSFQTFLNDPYKYKETYKHFVLQFLANNALVIQKHTYSWASNDMHWCIRVHIWLINTSIKHLWKPTTNYYYKLITKLIYMWFYCMSKILCMTTECFYRVWSIPCNYTQAIVSHRYAHVPKAPNPPLYHHIHTITQYYYIIAKLFTFWVMY